MIKNASWVLAVVTPGLILLSIQSLPRSWALVLCGVFVGVFISFLLLEYIQENDTLPRQVIAEQVLAGLLVLLLLALVV